jgi:hypothetical protein
MQPTNGWPVPYMRFTKSGNPQNNQTWFRQILFAGQNWQAGVFGHHNVEQCVASINVIILGQLKGVRDFLVTHDPNRAQNNNTPNTYLHYDIATQSDFLNTNLVGRWFEIRAGHGVLEIEIS